MPFSIYFCLNQDDELFWNLLESRNQNQNKLVCRALVKSNQIWTRESAISESRFKFKTNFSFAQLKIKTNVDQPPF